MELADVQAALRDVERELKGLRNKIAYREQIIQNMLGVVRTMKGEEETITDRYLALVAEERALKEAKK